jgi:hypothetical protein
LAIGAYDQTHVVKLNTLYDLPFGKVRRWLPHGFAAQALGGWRVSAIQVYNSGFPIAVTRNAPLNIFNGVNRPIMTTYNWKASWERQLRSEQGRLSRGLSVSGADSRTVGQCDAL